LPRNAHSSPLAQLAPRSPEGRIVRFMRERGDASAADIATGTELARSTVSTSLAELRRANIVVEVAQLSRSQGAGRPTSVFTLNPRVGTCVGLHLGLTSIRVIVADVSHAILHKADVELGADYEPAVAASVARKAALDAYASLDLSPKTMFGVGVSVAGPVAPDGRVQLGGIVPRWSGLDIRELFEPAFDAPVLADNESNCGALAELLWGAGANRDDFVYVKIDVGLGGAIVIERKLLRGVAGGAGEFGHMAIDGGTERCPCGNLGCLEITGSFRSALKTLSRKRRSATSIDDIVRSALSGDPECALIVSGIGNAVGNGLAVIGAVLNPSVVVVGGRGIAAGSLLLDPMRAAYESHALLKSKHQRPEHRMSILPAQFPVDGALMGAIALVLRGHAN
jgi:predicted NBD/HSP70 family sugar kinase